MNEPLLDRLSALPPDWQSDSLRTAVTEHDTALAAYRDVQERLAVARQGVEEAREGVVLGVDETWNALLAASQLLTACEMVAPRYPAPDAVHVDAAADIARSALGGALGLPEAPRLLVELESLASGTHPLRNREGYQQPVVLPAERLLIERLDAWRHERDDLRRAIASWDQPQVLNDTLSALSVAASLLQQASQHATTGWALVEQVEAANAERVRSGLEWDDRQLAAAPGSNHPVTPEQRRLRTFREERRTPTAVLV